MAESKLLPIQKHIEKLGRICRICKGALQTGKTFTVKVQHFADQIQLVFKYDLTNDKYDVHPQKLCSKYEGKLCRSAKNMSPLPDLKPHSKDCNLFNCSVGHPACPITENQLAQQDESPQKVGQKVHGTVVTLNQATGPLFSETEKPSPSHSHPKPKHECNYRKTFSP